jgi:flavin-binding protein dodecin
MIRVRQFPLEPGARPLPLQSYTKHVSSIRRVQKTFASVSNFAKVEEARGLYTNRKVPYFVTTLKIGWRLYSSLETLLGA